jgi:hypothetical protein
MVNGRITCALPLERVHLPEPEQMQLGGPLPMASAGDQVVMTMARRWRLIPPSLVDRLVATHQSAMGASTRLIGRHFKN